jgi:fibronectin type 3 domain-containing protein
VIDWEFDPDSEALINSFTLEHSENDRDYSDFLTPIDKTLRSITVPDVSYSSHYFAITANSHTGRKLRSFSVLVQPVDTVPPAVPTGLVAVADTSGVVRLTWQANSDKGSFGYRIFRGQNAEEELIPLNDLAHQSTEFVDSLDLRSLNSHVYYAITALDERYTQSDKTPVVEVKRPEVIPPTPPFIRNISVENGKNIVSWVSGGEPTLAGYDLYRQIGREGDFELLALVSGAENCEYEDSDVENDKVYTYRVLSRSEGGLLSEASPDYRVTAINKSAAAAVAVTFTATALGDKVRLSWNAPITDAINIQLYKKTGEGNFGLMREGLSTAGEIEDTAVASGVRYQYMLVVRSNSTSPISEIKDVVL